MSSPHMSRRAWRRSRPKSWASPGPAAQIGGDKHYYRVQGPGLLVEYDNTQNDGNHIHTVWRDPDRDFGRDLLAEHYAVAHV